MTFTLAEEGYIDILQPSKAMMSLNAIYGCGLHQREASHKHDKLKYNERLERPVESGVKLSIVNNNNALRTIH